MVFALACLVATLVYIWMNQVWLVALAMTLGTFLISVSIKMLFLPRSESHFYQKLFGEM
jgi:multisubunit Na+/H+ antiporter MnhB subunit